MRVSRLRLLGGLTQLAADVLANVVDTLALVRLGRTMAADLSGDLTDLLLVDTLDVHVGVVGNLEGDALGSLDDHGVREAQGELEVLALLLHAVTDAGELELLLEALGNANNHVVDERTSQTMQGSVKLILRRTCYRNNIAFHCDFHIFVKLTRELTFRTFYCHLIFITKRDGYASWDYDWCSTNS